MPVTLNEAWTKFRELCGSEPETEEEKIDRAREIDNICGFNHQELMTFITAQHEDGSEANDEVQEAVFAGAQAVYMGLSSERGYEDFPMNEDVWRELWNAAPWITAFTQDVLVMALKYGIFVGAIHARENASELRNTVQGSTGDEDDH